MEQLARIQARLQSLTELGNLVGALRSMAASRAREAQEAFSGTRAYTGIVERAIAGIAPLTEPPEPPANGQRYLLVVTSENGFVGGFNNRLIEAAQATRQPDEVLIVVGRRGEIVAQEQGIAPDLVLSMTSRVAGITPLARQIAARVRDVASARVIFAAYRQGAGFDVTTHPILPLSDMRVDHPPEAPLHHLPPDRLLADLAEEYLFAELAHALMESLASENAARLRTMDAASRNVSDKLEDLQKQERIVRQEETTSDMIDVVTGAEAVTSG